MALTPMAATRRDTGELIHPGATVTNFRGEIGTFQMITRGAIPGKSGKILVDGRESYDRAWGVKITALLPCGCVVSENADCVHLA